MLLKVCVCHILEKAILYADDTVILSESESDLQVDIRSKSTLKLELFLFGQKLFVENNPKYPFESLRLPYIRKSSFV
jgi:hypothetical protein